MATENQNVTVTRGDSHDIEVMIDNAEDGLKRLQLAGAELTWILYSMPYHVEILEKTTEAGGIKVLEASEGRVEVSLTAQDTAELKEGVTYKHALKVRDSIEHVSTVMRGNFIVKM